MKGFVFKFGVLILVLVVLVLVGLFTYRAGLERDYTDQVDGREKVLEGRSHSRDLLAVLRHAKEKDVKIEFLEGEINQYLAHKVKANQSGISAKYSEFKGVWVDLREDEIEIFMERVFYENKGSNDSAEGSSENASSAQAAKVESTDSKKKYKHSTSIVLLVKTTKDNEGAIIKEYKVKHGYCGKTKLPGMFALMVKSSFVSLLNSIEEEVKIGYGDMQQIKITDGKIELDPRQIRLEKKRPK